VVQLNRGSDLAIVGAANSGEVKQGGAKKQDSDIKPGGGIKEGVAMEEGGEMQQWPFEKIAANSKEIVKWNHSLQVKVLMVWKIGIKWCLVI
jgi:hypothetical protein